MVEVPHKGMRCPICCYLFFPNSKQLEQVYAWVSVDENGHEGFIAGQLGIRPVMMALMNSDLATARDLKDIAKSAIEGIPGYKVRLIKFGSREVIED